MMGDRPWLRISAGNGSAVSGETAASGNWEEEANESDLVSRRAGWLAGWLGEGGSKRQPAWIQLCRPVEVGRGEFMRIIVYYYYYQHCGRLASCFQPARPTPSIQSAALSDVAPRAKSTPGRRPKWPQARCCADGCTASCCCSTRSGARNRTRPIYIDHQSAWRRL